MTQSQPEALRLAHKYDVVGFVGEHRFAQDKWCRDAAAELRRQHARIEELEAQLAAVQQGMQTAVPDGYVVVSVEKINAAIQRGSVFDDGGDGADPESARSVVTLLRDMLTATQPAAQEGWCDGCSPDNCVGCSPAAPAQVQPEPSRGDES